jgi:hypothetical protein
VASTILRQLDTGVVLKWKQMSTGKDKHNIRIRIDYTTTVNLHSAGSVATSIRGSDIFVLAINPELDNGFVCIEQVLQKELSIGGNKNERRFL